MSIKSDDFDKLLKSVKDISVHAGKIILEVYGSDFSGSIENKKDNSPVTVADKKANRYIVDRLESLTPGIPVIAEESDQIDFEKRKKFDFFWLVDPLDGTKEFIKRNGDFTVNIALMQKDRPVMGIVYVPLEKKLYWAIEHKGAYLEYGDKIRKLKVKKINLNKKGLKILVSRSHLDNKTKDYINKFNEPIIEQRGSALKFLLIVEGKADIYFRFSPTMEWDTAASHIILKEAGNSLLNIETKKELNYNKKSLINPGFIVLSKENEEIESVFNNIVTK